MVVLNWRCLDAVRVRVRDGAWHMIDKLLNDSVRTAALELCCGDQFFKNRLVRAVRALERTLASREDWPPMLRRRAQDISDSLRGDIDAEAIIVVMDLPSAQRLAERILHLYADCHGILCQGT